MIKTGLEILLEKEVHSLHGKRIGLVTHPAAVLKDMTSCRDALLAAGVKLTALFAPEHGMSGAVADGAPVAHEKDPISGLPVYSLYGKALEPAADVLRDIDLMVFDMQDVGVRFYTFLSTLYHVMRACGNAGRPLIVLDRPNPIGGESVEGPLVAPGYESFIGVLPVPIRHGMTLGEMACYINHTRQMDVDLRVIPMQGWERSMWFDQTGLPWVPTSPAMAHFETTIPYPGTCFIEGTNLSEGRGTCLPFEILGAPWLDGNRLAQSLHSLKLPGVFFRPLYFEPCDGKYAHQMCQGVQLHVVDRQAFRPVEAGLHVLAACLRLTPERFEFLPSSWEGSQPHLDLLAGSADVRQGLETGAAIVDIVATWKTGCQEFIERRMQHLLY